jgi:hypothetical protein
MASMWYESACPEQTRKSCGNRSRGTSFSKFYKMQMVRGGPSRRAKLLAMVATIGGILTVGITGGARPRTNRPAASASSFAPDKGKLKILVSGQQVGSEEYEISASGDSWVARGNTQIKSADGSTRISGTLSLHADGTPARYEWSTQGAKKASAVVGFEGMTVTSELQMENARPFRQTFTFASPRIAVLDNNLYHQYAVLARMYDWNKKGAQTFPVLVPQELTPGSATVESLGKQDFGGGIAEELRVKTEDNEIDVFVDGPRLLRIVVPSANAEIVRE